MVKKGTYTLAILLIVLLSPASYAQNLDQLLNKDQEQGPSPDGTGQVMTSTDMAYIYFNNCMSEESLAFNKQEQETLCSCTAVNIADKLNVDEIRLIYENSSRGKDARGKMLSFCYAPCMEHVIEDKVKIDCYGSRYLSDIVEGKGLICACTAERYKQLIRDSAAHLITNALYHNPMSLNPLEDHFTDNNYFGIRDYYVQQCRYKFTHPQGTNN